MKRNWFTAVVVCLSFLAGRGAAQEDRAVVTGTVTDPSQSAIPGAIVEINSKATGFHREVLTNDSGVYVLPGLLVGVYDLRIRKDGFSTAQYAFELVVGQVRTINKQMQIAAGAQEVHVEAETTALEESSAKVGGVIDTSQVGNLPLNGRAWTSLMALVPGAIDSGGGTQKSIRFAGRGIDDTNYRFDGVDASGISAQSPNASFRLQISTEAIAEFKVDTMLYGADTGGDRRRAGGGHFEIRLQLSPRGRIRIYSQ
jgi:Carboxypeptidase regulatory-like domain